MYETDGDDLTQKPKIAVVAGPTATGKTALGVALALALDGEVVSADSMQIYRRMDIGTAKVTPEEMLGVPHHMTDIADPSEKFSVARFVETADGCVRDILSRGKLPVVVGGTGLYLDSLISGRKYDSEAFDEKLRDELSREYDSCGGAAMLSLLAVNDPQRAALLSPLDKKRIIRALEVYRLTGRTITEHDRETKALPDRYDAARVVLTFKSREALYSRIDSRVDSMAASGLAKEVRELLLSGVPETATAMQAIGYKEMAAALRGETTDAQAIELIKRESRRYAKRQLTWFRRWKDALWIEWESEPDFERGRQLATAFIKGKELK